MTGTRVLARTLGAVALAVVAGACASTRTITQGVEASQQPTTTTTTSTTTTTTSLRGPVGTPFTDTDSGGNVMSVTLTQIIDPAQGSDQFNTPNNGFRFVGAKFEITGVSGTFNNDANSDTVIVGSDGQSYTPDFDSIAGCTNFNHGEFTVTPGVSSTGCVTFQVPQSVQVASVQWGGGFGGNPATWTP